MAKKKRNEVKYALAEFQGIIIGVFEITGWYPIQTANNVNNNRWGFNGKDATEDIKNKYLNKSIMFDEKTRCCKPN